MLGTLSHITWPQGQAKIILGPANGPGELFSVYSQHCRFRPCANCLDPAHPSMLVLSCSCPNCFHSNWRSQAQNCCLKKRTEARLALGDCWPPSSPAQLPTVRRVLLPKGCKVHRSLAATFSVSTGCLHLKRVLPTSKPQKGGEGGLLTAGNCIESKPA